jgi:hypothetical protein
MRWTRLSALPLVMLALAVGCGGPVCEGDATCGELGVQDALELSSDVAEEDELDTQDAPEEPAEPHAVDGEDAPPPPVLDQDKSPFGDIYGVAIEAFEGSVGSTRLDEVEPWAFADADEGLLELTLDFRDDVEGDGYLKLIALWPDFPEGHACDVALNQGGALLQAFVDVDDDLVLDVMTMARAGDVSIVKRSETETELQVEASFNVDGEPQSVFFSVVLTR